MYYKRHHLDRRTVLKGIGSTIFLPLFEAMLPASARAAEAMQAPRLLMHYYPNGTYPNFKNGNKFPQHVYDALTGGGDGLGDYLNMISNISTDGLKSFPGNSHVSAFIPLMSASKIDYDKWVKKKGPGYDVMQETFDQRYARAFNLKTLSGSCETLSSYIESFAHVNILANLSWYKDGSLHKPVAAETDPRVLFNKLVGGQSMPRQRTVDNSKKIGDLNRKQLVLDSVKEQIPALKKRLSAHDKIK